MVENPSGESVAGLEGKQGAEAEVLGMPVALREKGPYTVQGGDLIRNLQLSEVPEKGDIAELRLAVREAQIFSDGFLYGSGELDLENREALVSLEKKFTTIGGSIVRAADQQVREAVDDALSRPVRESQARSKDPEEWEKKRKKSYLAEVNARREASVLRITEERIIAGAEPSDKEVILKLLAVTLGDPVDVVNSRIKKEALELDNILNAVQEIKNLKAHVEALRLVDQAFVQRQLTSPFGDKQAELEKYFNLVPIPDKGDMIAFFQNDTEFGAGVDKVMRRMVDVGEGKVSGISKDIYAKGFSDDEGYKFSDWITKMQDASGGRIDVTFAAWKMAHVMELITHYGKRTNESGVYKFGTPPIVSSLFKEIMYVDENRQSEWGLDKDFKRVKEEAYLRPDRTGHPFSFDKIGTLCDTFLHETEVRWKGEDVSLFKIWYEEGVSFEDNSFPWSKTSGAFDTWKLKAGRSWGALTKLIRSFPDSSEMRDIKFFTGLRSADKIGLIQPELDIKEPLNPTNKFVWILGGWINFHIARSASRNKQSPVLPNWKSFQGKNSHNKLRDIHARKAGGFELSVNDVLNNAVEAKVISPAEKQWLISNVVKTKFDL